MSSTSQTPFSQSPEPMHSAPPERPGFFEAIFARLPVIYLLLGLLLLVLSCQDPVRIGSAGNGLATAGGLCFIASAIAYQRG